MAVLLGKMRCSKVRVIVVVLIFSIVAGVQLLLSHSGGDDREGSHLTPLFSSKWRSEAKTQGETWISGKLLQSSEASRQ